MAGPSKVGKKELVKLAREQADVLVFADRNREIVELPPASRPVERCVASEALALTVIASTRSVS
jgi:hypothetical protein